MTLQIKDRIRETSITTGTSTYTLGGAVAGFNPLSDISDGDTCYYLVQRGSEYEIGLGTVGGSGTTLTRDSVLRSSNADAAVDWGSGTKEIACGITPANLLSVLGELTGTLSETIDDRVAALMVAGDGLTKSYDDVANTLTFAIAALTADRAMITDGDGLPAVASVTATELGYVAGATSSLQAQITALQALTIRQPKVINRVDNTAAPPTTDTGDRYLLDDTGSSHANWNGAAANSIVEFNGTTWDESVPAEGWVVYNDASDTDWLAIDDGSLSWQERTAGAVSLNGLIDVVVNSATADDVLIYDGSTWRNQPQSDLSITVSQVTDFDESVDDRVNTLLIAGSGVTLTYDDGANTLTIDAGAAVGQLADLTDVDDSLAGNKGDLLFHDNDDWTDLDIGSPNDRLEVRDGLPSWQAPGPGIVITARESSVNVDLSSASDPNPVGGATLTDGQLVLLEAQSTPGEKGIYTAVTATDPTTWTREPRMAAGSSASGRIVHVLQGSFAGQTFLCSAPPGSDVIGTDGPGFARIN